MKLFMISFKFIWNFSTFESLNHKFINEIGGHGGQKIISFEFTMNDMGQWDEDPLGANRNKKKKKHHD